MKKMKLLLAGMILLFMVACEQDTYNKGEGTFSTIRGEFVEAHAGADKKIDYVVLDNDEQLNVVNPFEASWVKKADSLYRAVFYFKEQGEKITAVSVSPVTVVRNMVPADSVKDEMKTDPLTLESLWVGKNKRYLNAGLILKTGETISEKDTHRMGLVADTLIAHTNGKRTLCLRLFHDQGGVPEYYSQRAFFSVPLTDLTADSIQLTINTYDGVITKCLSIK